MITIRVEADDVANVRFAADPIWELGAALFAAAQPNAQPNAHSVHRRLRGQVAPPTEVGGPSLWDLTRVPGWTPDILAPQPRTTPMSVQAALASLRETDVALAAGDQEVIRRHLPGSAFAGMTPATFLDVVSGLLEGFWTISLSSVWDRVEAVARQDIVANQRSLALEGFATTVRALHPGLRYHQSVVTVDLPLHQDVLDASGRGLWFVPSVFRWPKLCITSSARDAPFVISYPARGAATVWIEQRPSARSLTPVIGRSRAAILAELRAPGTTTSLATTLNLAPGTVSGHLSAMVSSGLLTSERVGREVLYSLTETGAGLLAANDR